jgi:hypothetical protein
MLESWVEPAISASVNDHDHRRLGERREHRLAARPDAAEGGADVHAGEGEKETRSAEQRDDGDEVGGPVEQQADGEGRHQRGGDPGGGEDEVGDDAEQPGGVLRDQRLFAQQADEIEIGLNQWRPHAAQQPRLHLAHEAGQERRQQQHEEHLRALDGEGRDQGHSASTRSSDTSAKNTRLRYWRMVRN